METWEYVPVCVADTGRGRDVAELGLRILRLPLFASVFAVSRTLCYRFKGIRDDLDISCHRVSTETHHFHIRWLAGWAEKVRPWRHGSFSQWQSAGRPSLVFWIFLASMNIFRPNSCFFRVHEVKLRWKSPLTHISREPPHISFNDYMCVCVSYSFVLKVELPYISEIFPAVLWIHKKIFFSTKTLYLLFGFIAFVNSSLRPGLVLLGSFSLSELQHACQNQSLN